MIYWIRRCSHSPEPAGGYVVGMAFTVAGFFENLLAGPAEFAEVIGQQNASEEGGGAGATAHSERDFVVQTEVQWLDRACCFARERWRRW